MTRFRAPAPPYLGPAYRSSAGDNKPIRRIVMHSTVSPCERGGARNIAAYFRSSAAGGSAHYVVDPFETVQVVFDSVVAWHAPPNGNSLGVEMCDMPHATSLARWDDENHRLMFDRAVDLVADLCLSYGVPPWYRGALALRAGMRGVTEHDEVSKAWGQSSHWDCGAWPRRRFMVAVRKAIRSKKKEAATAARRSKRKAAR